MLHQSAVPLNLFELLVRLQPKTTAAGFALAGGTSLALRLGHRVSVDLDFFTVSHFDPRTLADQIGVGSESITGFAAGTLQLRLGDIKVEFLKHSYPRIAEDQRTQGVNMWSMEDVCAMKLNAITNRGSKKDFYDIAALLPRFPLETMIRLYQQKYRPPSLLMVIRSLAWFDDADAEPDPISLRNEPWSAIKDQIAIAIRALS
jgi:hypothetical protein